MADRDANRPGEEPAATAPAHEGPYPAMMRYQLMTPRAPLAPGAGIRMYPYATLPHHHPDGWWADDPTGRHQVRWWSGLAWTDHVADDGETSLDPLDPA